MRVLSAICHNKRLRIRWNDRCVQEHTPTRIIDELNAKGFHNLNMTMLFG